MTTTRSEPQWWASLNRWLVLWGVLGPLLGTLGTWWLTKARYDAFTEVERKATIERVVRLEGEVTTMKDKTLVDLKQQLDVLSGTVQAELQRRQRRPGGQ